MKTKECPSCAMEIPKKSEECPICNYEFPAQPKSHSWIIWLVLISFVLMTFGGIAVFF
jgi:RNA polymerase subunit RPABC4/transcription elongation factor Spt4